MHIQQHIDGLREEATGLKVQALSGGLSKTSQEALWADATGLRARADFCAMAQRRASGERTLHEKALSAVFGEKKA